jgi:hypothetical protein
MALIKIIFLKLTEQRVNLPPQLQHYFSLAQKRLYIEERCMISKTDVHDSI